jgi:hypothetical protein
MEPALNNVTSIATKSGVPAQSGALLGQIGALRRGPVVECGRLLGPGVGGAPAAVPDGAGGAREGRRAPSVKSPLSVHVVGDRRLLHVHHGQDDALLKAADPVGGPEFKSKNGF